MTERILAVYVLRSGYTRAIRDFTESELQTVLHDEDPEVTAYIFNGGKVFMISFSGNFSTVKREIAAFFHGYVFNNNRNVVSYENFITANIRERWTKAVRAAENFDFESCIFEQIY